jgi:hypothetical protein
MFPRLALGFSLTIAFAFEYKLSHREHWGTKQDPDLSGHG